MLERFSKRVLIAVAIASFLASTLVVLSFSNHDIINKTLNSFEPLTAAVSRPWRKAEGWPARCTSRPYQVLALGDSITAGWEPVHPSENTPYSAQLSSVVRHPLAIYTEALPGRKSQEVLDKLVEAQRHNTYDIIIIMSGANDILAPEATEAFDPEPVIHTLEELWRTALAGSTETLLVILNLFDIAYEPYDQRVKTLNALIPDAVAKLESDRVSLMDINAQFTMNGMTPEDTTRYWADPVHPSGEGYRLMGQLIGKHLDGLIRC